MSSVLSLPISIRSQFNPWLDRNINEISYTYLRQLQLKFDANRNVIRDLAAAIPKLPWNSNKIDDILSKESPGEEILHILGVLNKNLSDVISYMETIEFWAGLEIFLESFPPMLLEDPPKKINLRTGESLMLSCKAAGIPAPIYQWYYYPGQNPVVIEGERRPTLNLTKPEWLGDKVVVCSICNALGQIFTSASRISIEGEQDIIHGMDRRRHQHIPPPVPPPKEVYTAKDKVALLIGNGKYLCEKKLDAPPNDILRIGKSLKQMGFKTLICRDLTKASMESVIEFFTNLLVEEGVYGVLYFAGHGFETSRGNCYLVPSDSPTQASPAACVSYRNVLNQMLDKKPAMCLVVLDICRVRKAEDTPDPKPVKLNDATMVVYATNEDKKAYEMQGQGSEPLSVFASHLLKHIKEPVPLIDLMLSKVVPSISEDRLAKKHGQLAEITLTLSTQRSLHDPVDFQGATMKYEKCMLEWESVNKRPELQEHDVESLGVTVKMVSTYEYSNSLIIYIGCIKKDPDVAFKALAHISAIENTPTVTCDAIQMFDPEYWPDRMGFRNNRDCISVTKNVLNGIETLACDLKVHVFVTGSTQEGTSVDKELDLINLRRPLLAKLNLANNIHSQQQPPRVPVQHEENNAVEHDESFYQQVAVEQESFAAYSHLSQS